MLRIPQSYIDELLAGDWALHDGTTEGMGLKGQYVVTAWPTETGIVAGIEIAERIFKTLGLRTEMVYGDGDHAFMHSPILRAWARLSNFMPLTRSLSALWSTLRASPVGLTTW